jgi:hypothetical protein
MFECFGPGPHHPPRPRLLRGIAIHPSGNKTPHISLLKCGVSLSASLATAASSRRYRFWQSLVPGAKPAGCLRPTLLNRLHKPDGVLSSVRPERRGRQSFISRGNLGNRAGRRKRFHCVVALCPARIEDRMPVHDPPQAITIRGSPKPCLSRIDLEAPWQLIHYPSNP